MKICLGGVLAAIMGKKLGARWMPGVPVVADPGQVRYRSRARFSAVVIEKFDILGCVIVIF